LIHNYTNRLLILGLLNGTHLVVIEGLTDLFLNFSDLLPTGL